jgi:hypothetical protein
LELETWTVGRWLLLLDSTAPHGVQHCSSAACALGTGGLAACCLELECLLSKSNGNNSAAAACWLIHAGEPATSQGRQPGTLRRWLAATLFAASLDGRGNQSRSTTAGTRATSLAMDGRGNQSTRRRGGSSAVPRIPDAGAEWPVAVASGRWAVAADWLRDRESREMQMRREVRRVGGWGPGRLGLRPDSCVCVRV